MQFQATLHNEFARWPSYAASEKTFHTASTLCSHCLAPERTFHAREADVCRAFPSFLHCQASRGNLTLYDNLRLKGDCEKTSRGTSSGVNVNVHTKPILRTPYPGRSGQHFVGCF